MVRKQLVWAIGFLCFWFSAHAQQCHFLDERNGFRDIKLGADIKAYSDFSRQDNDNKKLFTKYAPDADYVYLGKESDKIQNARILYIFIKSGNGAVDEISVITYKEDGISSLLESAFGEPTSKLGASQIWKGDKVQCTLWGDNSPFPGCKFTYKLVDEGYAQLKRMRKELAVKAQSAL